MDIITEDIGIFLNLYAYIIMVTNTYMYLHNTQYNQQHVYSDKKKMKAKIYNNRGERISKLISDVDFEKEFTESLWKITNCK